MHSTLPDGWTSSQVFDGPFQPLSPDEIDAYLDFQFSEIELKVSAIPLDVAAAVVRYLRILALKGVPEDQLAKGPAAVEEWRLGDQGEARRRLECLAAAIWQSVYNFSTIEPASKGTTQVFLQKFAPYWDGLDDIRRIEVEQFELPSDAGNPFDPPNLVGRGISVQGTKHPRQRSGLSRRIAVADIALEEGGVRSRHKRIADRLSRWPLPATKRAEWCAEDVRDRIQKFRKDSRKDELVLQARASVHYFRFAKQLQRDH